MRAAAIRARNGWNSEIQGISGAGVCGAGALWRFEVEGQQDCETYDERNRLWEHWAVYDRCMLCARTIAEENME